MKGAGRFVTIEGIEGVGKSTQLTRISGMLTARGVDHQVTREPGGTPLAEQIRHLVLAPREEFLPPVAELLMMFAARAVHLANFIEPHLDAGRVVICDRFTDATYAYQGAGRGLRATWIGELEKMVQGERRPDLTFLLDLAASVGLGRSQKRDSGKTHDRFETERLDFFERVREAYLERARAEPGRIIIIDAARSEDEVTASMVAVLESKSWIV